VTGSRIPPGAVFVILIAGKLIDVVILVPLTDWSRQGGSRWLDTPVAPVEHGRSESNKGLDV